MDYFWLHRLWCFFAYWSCLLKEEVEGCSILGYSMEKELMLAIKNTPRFRSSEATDVELLSSTLQITRSHPRQHTSRRHRRTKLTPPSPSLTTSTNPLRTPLRSSHFLYNVPKLTPSSSRLYIRFHCSQSCSLGGTSNLISSASVLVSRRADCEVDLLYPFKLTGYRGGG